MDSTHIYSLVTKILDQKNDLWFGFVHPVFALATVVSILGFIAATYVRNKHEEKLKARRAAELTQYFGQAISSFAREIPKIVATATQFAMELRNEKLRVPMMLFVRSLGFENYDAIPIMEAYEALVSYRIGSKEIKTLSFAEIHRAVGSIKNTWEIMQEQHNEYVTASKSTETNMHGYLEKILDMNNRIEKQFIEGGEKSLSLMDASFRVSFHSCLINKPPVVNTPFFWYEDFFKALELQSRKHLNTDLIALAQTFHRELSTHKILREAYSDAFQGHSNSLKIALETSQNEYQTLLNMPALKPSYVIPNWLLHRRHRTKLKSQ